MSKIGFKEFYETKYMNSKQKLLAACDDTPRMRNEYKLTKYCKFPVYESTDSDDKIYVAFRPKDRIQVLWEQVNEHDDYPIPKSIYLYGEEKEVFPCWNNKKFMKWIENSTIES
jgi:hypothetical protein